MATTLASLQDQLRVAVHADSVRRADDPAAALEHLGRAVTRLAEDGLHHDWPHRRDDLAANLVAACGRVAAAERSQPQGRITDLAGAVADVVATLAPEGRSEERWALTVRLAATARWITAMDGDDGPPSRRDLREVRRRADELRGYAVRDPARPWAQALADRPIPSPSLPPGTPHHVILGEAAVNLADALRRPVTQDADLKTAVTAIRAAELIATYAVAAHRELGTHGAPAPVDAPASWRAAAELLRPCTDGLRWPGNDVVRHSLQAAHAAAAAFGPPGQVTATSLRRQADLGGCLTALRLATNQLPHIADRLGDLIRHWGRTGTLRAPAHRLPFREERLDQQLRRELVAVDHRDLAPVDEAFRSAGRISAWLAVDLDSGIEAGRQPQPNLIERFRHITEEERLRDARDMAAARGAELE